MNPTRKGLKTRAEETDNMISLLLNILLMHPMSLLAGVAIGYMLPGDVARAIQAIKSKVGSKLPNVIDIKDKL